MGEACCGCQVFMMIEALADGGVKMGLPRDVAQQLAAHTLMVGVGGTLLLRSTYCV